MKRRISYCLSLVTLLVAHSSICNAQDCNINMSNPKQIAYTITVDKAGHGNFTTIQSAIDSIPLKNNQWIRIQISPGTYTEKVIVSVKKPCLFFEGAGANSTSIEWDDHDVSSSSATVSFFAINILLKGIAFKNTYNFNLRPPPTVHWKQAVSARVENDRVAFHDCAFYGIQDTLQDELGRHYYNNCYIEGSVDFIFGHAKTIYENCHIYVNMGRYVADPERCSGWITAEKNEHPTTPGGYVFKSCKVNGVGKASLGRAWGAYATVIFANSDMSDVVNPKGWDAWDFIGHESNFTFVEANNVGQGSDLSQRVPWIKKLNDSQLEQFLDISWINAGGWIEKMPL